MGAFFGGDSGYLGCRFGSRRGSRSGLCGFFGGGSCSDSHFFKIKLKFKVIRNQTVGLAAQPGKLHKHGNGQAVAFHGVVEIVIGDHIIQTIRGDIQRGKAYNGTGQVNYHRCGDTALSLEAFCFAGQQKQPQRKQRNGNAAQIVDNHAHHNAAEFIVIDDTSRTGKNQGRTHIVKVGVTNEQFRHHHCGTQENDNTCEPAGCLPGQSGGDYVQQTTQAEGKANQCQKEIGRKHSADPVMKQQFQITNCGNQHPAGEIGGFFLPLFPNGFELVHYRLAFLQQDFDSSQNGLYNVHLCFSFSGKQGKGLCCQSNPADQ